MRWTPADRVGFWIFLALGSGLIGYGLTLLGSWAGTR